MARYESRWQGAAGADLLTFRVEFGGGRHAFARRVVRSLELRMAGW